MKTINKNAHAFGIEEHIEGGIVLLGSEVKAIRGGHADLSGSYVKIIGKEAFLINAKIFPYEFSRKDGYQEDRTRKLLLHKKEILALKSKLDQKNLTLIPLSIYELKGRFKLDIALAHGKKKEEKRRDAKSQALARAADRDIKNRF